MTRQTEAEAKLPYTADPYGYARRLTREVRIGKELIGNPNLIAVQGRVTVDPLETELVLAQVTHFTDQDCKIIRVPAPSVGTAWNLNQVITILQARQIKPAYIAEGTGSFEALLAALEWADGIQLRLNVTNPGENNPNYSERELEVISRECATHSQLIEISSFTDVSECSPQKLVEPLITLAYLAQKLNFPNLLFSLEATSPILQIEAYRYLAARFNVLEWDYPVHLGFTALKPTLVERSQAALALGSLLEDGIGDSLHISFEQNSTQYQEIELAYRIVRRYTSLPWQTLESVGVGILDEVVSSEGALIVSSADGTQFVVATDRANNLSVNLNFPDDQPYASEKKIPEYPYVIANLPDYRHPYRYQRQTTSEIKVGNISIGGGQPLVTLGRLSSARITQLYQLESQVASATLASSSSIPTTEPDIYLINNLSEEVKCLKTQGKLIQPLVVGVQTVEQLKEALSVGAEAVSFGLDYVGQIGEEIDELEKVVEMLGELEKPLPLFLISTHNAGQSWGSYDYWPAFMEAYQMIQAIELCQKSGVSQLIVGIYTYNSAWNTQNYRLLTALMLERGWNYPVQLIAPDLVSNVAEEYLIDAGISLGGLLVDGIGDCVQFDYLPRRIDRYPEGYSSFEANPLSIEQLTTLAASLIEAIKFPSK